jgi:hypothetical protein
MTDDDQELIRKTFAEIEADMLAQQEAFWNSLTKEQQLDAFCAVVARIYQGEILENRSYRGVLYDIFGFGPEAYMPAQLAGYLTIHNELWNLGDRFREARKMHEQILQQAAAKAGGSQ